MIIDSSYLESGFSDNMLKVLNPVEEEESDAIASGAIDDELNESYTTPRKVNRILSNGTDFYIYSNAYENYIESCIDNELIIKDFIFNKMNETSVFTEAEDGGKKLQDAIIQKFDGFTKFIDSILDRFWIALDKIVNSKKAYLDKYKDTILKNQFKEDFQITYTGNYSAAMSRIKEQLPPFDYNAHSKALREEGYESIAKTMLGGKDFRYNSETSKDLAKNFKNYFIGASDLDNPTENGPVKVSTLGVSSKEMFDFVYNSQNLVNSVKRDRANLSRSRNAIANAIANAMKDNNTTVNTNTNAGVNPVASNNASGQTNTTTPQSGGQQKANASYYDPSNDWISLSEAGENDQASTSSDSGKDDTNSTDNGAKITTSDDNKDNATNNGEETPKPKTNTVEQDMNNITKKWIEVSRSFCTGKLTAIQQISKDFMTILTEHVKAHTEDKATPAKEENVKKQQSTEGQAGTANQPANQQTK